MKRLAIILILTLSVFAGKVSGDTNIEVGTSFPDVCVNAGSNQSMCQGTTSPALGGSIGGTATSATWSTPAGGTFSPSANDVNATWTPPPAYTGTATLTLTSHGGSCDGHTDTKTVTVHSSPTVTFSSQPGSGNICGNVEVTYTTQNTMTNYVWGFPGTASVDYTITSGGTGSDRTAKLKYLTAGSKIVTVNYDDANGCSAASATSSTATPVNIPNVTFTAQPGAGPVCGGVDVTYTTQASMTSYVWGFPGVLNTDYSITSGGTGADNTVTLKYLTSGSKIVTVNYNDANGCTAVSATPTTATSVSIPTVTFPAQPGASACVGIDVTYTTESAMTNYVWTFPGVLSTDYTITSGGTSADNTVTLKYLTAGSKTVTINYTSSGCTALAATSSTTTAVHPLPTVTFTSEPGANACLGVNVTYTTQASMTNYVWGFPGVLNTDYSITSGGTSGNNTATIKYLTTTGTKTVTINYTNSDGCTATSSTSGTATTVHSLPTVTLTTQPGAGPVCAGVNVTYTTQASMTSYVWGFPGVLNTDYSITSGGTGADNTVTLKYLTAGSKVVTVNYTNSNGCTAASASSSSTTTINPFPSVTFTAQPGVNACLGLDVTYITQGSMTSYVWGFPGILNTDYSITSGGTSGDNSVTLKYLTTGSKTVTINYTNSNSCTAASVTSSTATSVNPLPVVSLTAQPGAGPLCAGVGITYSTQGSMTSYTWGFPGVLNTDYSITSGGTGTDNTVTLKYLTPGSKTVTVNYINTNGCTATSTTSSISTAINAFPVIAFSAQPGASVCQSIDVTYTTDPAMTNYVWGFPGVLNINYSITSGGTSSDNTVTLKYLTAGSKTVNINYSNANGCSAALPTSSTATIVNPTPSVTNPAALSICGGTSPNISLTSSTPSSFAWTIGAITGGIIGASAGSGGTINQTLVNPSSLTAGTLEYLVTPTSTTGSCVGSAYSIVVSVNPLPRLTGASQAASICGGSTATINLLGLLPGTTSTVSYDVNSVAQPPVTGVLANGSGSASCNTGVLTAVNNGQILRITGIQTTSSTPSCSQTFTQDLTMSVDPPTIGGSISSSQIICSGSAPADLVLSGNTGSVVKWQKSSDAGFSSPTDISVTSTTLTGATIGILTSSTYFRAVVKSGVCSQANSASILVTVNALPVPTIGGPSSVNVTSTGNVYNTESGMTGYSWIVSAGGIITTGTGTNSITVTWNNPGAQTIRVNYTNSNLCTAATATVYNVTVNAKPIATNVSILGDPRSGLTLNGAYVYSDADGDLEGTTVFQWYTGISSSGAGPVPIAAATAQTYTLTDAELGKFIGFSVTPKAQTGATPGNMVTTITWVGPVINDAPKATSVAITGSLNVNGVLIGHYTYSDKEGDIEATSTFQWYSSSSIAGPFTPISGETFSTHLIGNNEQALYFKFFVTPVAASGTLSGIEVQSAGYGPANSQPYADNVSISGIPNLGSTLTGSFSFHDIDGNPQGATTFRWLRNGTIPIPGATNTTYLLVSADEGFTISFEVTPVSSAGFPTSGTPVLSSPTAVVVDPSPAVPFADQVCISGIRKPNQVLTGKYYYNFYKIEGTSTYRWLKNNVAIPGATSINYTLTASDISSKQEITFEVTPVSSNSIPKVGPPVKSDPIARIKLTQASYSLADPPFTLVANISGGVFSGKGVSAGVFSPASADTTGSPHKISYLLNITNTNTTCSQQANDSIYIVPIHAYFVNLKSVYCFDGKRDTISVTNVPVSATNLKFSSSNHSLIVDSIPPYKVVIDPKRKQPGIIVDTLYFSFKYAGSYFPILKTFETDSVGPASIKNLNAGDAFCNNLAPFTMYPSHVGTGGVFTGPVDGSTLDPSKGLGNTIVNFTYTNSRTGCFSTIDVPITINPAPKVSFVPKAVCILNYQDSVRFYNYSTSSDPIAGWLWEFVDGGLSTSNKKKEPAYPVKNGGQHVVSLTATTIKNCIVKKDSTIDIGVKPIVDFRWEKECFQASPADSIMLINLSSSTSKITASRWNFFDGKPALNGDTVKYPKTVSGYQSVRLTIVTPYANCSDSIFKQVYIRPSISLATDDYFQNFESGNGGWVKDYVTSNSWSFGTPGKMKIKYAASGVNAWVTNFTKDTVRSESIISPCFDFTNIQRPMISVKLWKAFDRNRDGASLQYKIGDKGTWQYVGTLDDGITWFNSPLIKGRPGGDQLGWTAGTTIADKQDTSWIESRHSLDELSGNKNVIFRIAYGSDGTATDNDGIAFDDVSIARRTRSVMLEHFTNNSSSSSTAPTATVSDLSKGRYKDVINIQYHTNFPGSDQYYNDNPGDASARFLFYGLSRAPYTILDGGTKFNADRSLNYANIYDYLIADLDSNDLTRRSLTDPSFLITLNDTLVGGVVKVKGKITALKAINAENVTLYLVVTEKQNTLSGKLYQNVFRKFMPDAAGTSLNKTWAKNDTYTITEKTWVMQKILPPSDIEIIAFLQNNITKEVYQAQSGIQHNAIVGIDNLFANNGRGFSLYPNPSVQRLTVAFEDILQAQTDITIYDFKGTVVRTYRIGTGESEFTIENLGIPSGIYLVRVKSGGIDWGFRKLLISKD